MANKSLFQSARGALLPAPTANNAEGAPAYALPPKHALAQYAATGCLSNTFYAGAEEQLATVLSLARELDAAFIAKTAIYARTKGSMKDMPALLLAIPSTKDSAMLQAVFPRVIDNGRMVRNFVQILRSGREVRLLTIFGSDVLSRFVALFTEVFRAVNAGGTTSL